MNWNKVQAFLEEARRKEQEKRIMTYEDFLEAVKSIQLPKWRLINDQIRADDSSHRGPIEVLSSLYSHSSYLVSTPQACAATLGLEHGGDLALIIMKAESNEWMDEPLVQHMRKDLLKATRLNDEDNAAGALAIL